MFESTCSRNANGPDRASIGDSTFFGDTSQPRGTAEHGRSNAWLYTRTAELRCRSDQYRAASANTGGPSPRLPEDVASTFVWSGRPQ